ncbi:unnamed protein product, partial [Prorocentrum cordatum]
GIRALREAASAGPGSGPDGAWGHAAAVARLRALGCADTLRRRAEDAYCYGDFEAAVARYGAALDATPSDDRWGRATLLTSRAACHRRARDLRLALKDLDGALGLFPRYARAMFRRGVCLLEAGSSKDAVRAFQQLLRVDRHWPGLCDWLVRAHAHRQRAERGDGSFGFAADDDQGSPGAARGGATEGVAEGDLYAVLGVPADATDKQLKRAYRLMSLKYHPDKQGGSTRSFQLIATAYETLSDPEKRRAYDSGADIKKGKNDDGSSSESERQERSLHEEVERKYFPERYRFWPFGDPFIEKRKLQARRRRRAGGRRIDPEFDDF